MAAQTAIPCTMMRGGTSRGPYFLANDLPRDPVLRDEVLLTAMGSGNAQQIDGIGGGTSLSSKVAIVSVSRYPDADVDYLFAQVSVTERIVDCSPSCGNMLAGVAPFAIESGLVTAEEGETLVRVHNINTDSFIEVVVQTPNGKVEYDGDTSINGVEGTAAPVVLNFLDVAGTKTGHLLPTGNLRDVFDGVEVSCVDAAMPMVLIPASSLGKSGWESKAELDSDRELLARIESIRRQASLKMGLGDAAGKVLPKVSLMAPPQHGGTISSRYFVPTDCHAAHAVTGAICVSTAAMLPGTIAYDLADRPVGEPIMIGVEHPSGKIDIVLDLAETDKGLQVNRAGLIRTARKLFRGELYIPSRIWSHLQAKAS